MLIATTGLVTDTQISIKAAFIFSQCGRTGTRFTLPRETTKIKDNTCRKWFSRHWIPELKDSDRERKQKK